MELLDLVILAAGILVGVGVGFPLRRKMFGTPEEQAQLNRAAEEEAVLAGRPRIGEVLLYKGQVFEIDTVSTTVRAYREGSKVRVATRDLVPTADGVWELE